MSVDIATDPFNDLTEVIDELGSPEMISVESHSIADTIVIDTPVVPAPESSGSKVPPVPLKTSRIAPTKMRKPSVKEKTSEVITSKPTKSVVSRLTLSARTSTQKPTPEPKVKSILLRLPRALHAPLLSFFPIESLKNLSCVGPELYNLVNSNYIHWSRGDADPTTQGLLSDAVNKVQERREYLRNSLRQVGDINLAIKVEDLRVLRTYRNPPPAVLSLSKAIIHLMRFAPPKGGVDSRAAAGDWGVIKNQFLDLKCIIKALKSSIDSLTIEHLPPLPLSKIHLEELVNLAFGPDLDDAKFKRTCAALVPTQTIVKKIIASLNVELRALDLTQQFKRHPHDTAENDVQAILSKLESPVPSGSASQPEASPLPSPTAADKPAKVSRIISRSSTVKAKAPVKVEAVKSAVEKPAVRKVTPRISTTTSRAAKPQDETSSNSSTPRATKTSVGTRTTKSTTASSTAPKKSSETSEPKAIVKRTPLSARALPTRQSPAPLAKKNSLSITDSKEVKRTASATSPTTSMASLRAELEKTKKDLLAQTTLTDEKSAQLTTLTESNLNLETQLKQIQEELAEVKIHLSLSQKEAETQHAELLEVKCVHETLQFRMNEMKEVDATQVATINSLTAEKDQLAVELIHAQERAIQMEAQVAEKQNELDTIEEQHNERELELRESMQVAATNDQESLVKQIDELKQTISTLQAEHQVELTNKQRRLDQVMEEKELLGKGMAQRDRFVEAVQSEKSKLVLNLQVAQSQTYNLNQKIEVLQDELEKERKRVAVTEAAYEESLRWHSDKVEQSPLSTNTP